MTTSKIAANSGSFRLLGFLLLFLYTALIIAGALLHPSRIPVFLLKMNDKAVHASEFFILFWVTLNAFRYFARENRTLLVLGYCAALAILTEALQTMVPYRAPDFADFSADAFGVFLAWRIAAIFMKKRD